MNIKKRVMTCLSLNSDLTPEEIAWLNAKFPSEDKDGNTIDSKPHDYLPFDHSEKQDLWKACGIGSVESKDTSLGKEFFKFRSNSNQFSQMAEKIENEGTLRLRRSLMIKGMMETEGLLRTELAKKASTDIDSLVNGLKELTKKLKKEKDESCHTELVEVSHNQKLNPVLEEVKTYFLENNFPDQEALKFYNYFSSVGWLVGGKTPMVDWQAAAQNWIINAPKFISNVEQPNRAKQLNSTTDKDYAEPL